jgi:hypothetical protein
MQRFATLLLTVLALVVAFACGSPRDDCRGPDLLRCRMERSDDPEIRAALEPFLEAEQKPPSPAP